MFQRYIANFGSHLKVDAKFGVGFASLGQFFKTKQLAVNVISLAPGGQISLPLKEDLLEGFSYIISGHPTIGIDTQSHRLSPGHAVGFSGESGISPSFFNDGSENAVIISIGESINEKADLKKPEPKKPKIIYTPELANRKSYSYPGDTETFAEGVRLSDPLGLQMIGIHHDVLPPGKRSSWPHAESQEEEYCFVLKGQPTIWINGYLMAAAPGDLIYFEPGTNLAHTVMNESADPVEYLGFGLSAKACLNNLIHYPFHALRNEQCRARGDYWEGRPPTEMGPHDGRPK